MIVYIELGLITSILKYNINTHPLSAQSSEEHGFSATTTLLACFL